MPHPIKVMMMKELLSGLPGMVNSTSAAFGDQLKSSGSMGCTMLGGKAISCQNTTQAGDFTTPHRQVMWGWTHRTALNQNKHKGKHRTLAHKH